MSELVTCWRCDGRGTWPERSRWWRRTPRLQTPHPKDQTHRLNNGPWIKVCGACRGTGKSATGDGRVGYEGQRYAPHFGACGACRTPWAWVEGHSTLYNGHSGMFPLCEACWSERTPEQRLPHYMVLLDQWEADGIEREPGLRDDVRAAVEAGL